MTQNVAALPFPVFDVNSAGSSRHSQHLGLNMPNTSSSLHEQSSSSSSLTTAPNLLSAMAEVRQSSAIQESVVVTSNSFLMSELENMEERICKAQEKSQRLFLMVQCLLLSGVSNKTDLLLLEQQDSLDTRMHLTHHKLNVYQQLLSGTELSSVVSIKVKQQMLAVDRILDIHDVVYRSVCFLRMDKEPSMQQQETISVASSNKASLSDKPIVPDLPELTHTNCVPEEHNLGTDVTSPKSPKPGTRELPKFDVAVLSEKGLRPYMEDTYSAKAMAGHKLYGVFDGHGGEKASKYCATHLLSNVIKLLRMQPEDVPGALHSGFMETEEQFLNQARSHNWNDGTTALVLCICSDQLHVAHCGDSRLVLVRQGDNAGQRVQALTEDHRPGDKKEAAMILERGGKAKAQKGSIPRVYPGACAFTRSIGDLDAKPVLNPEPEVCSLSLDKDMHSLVLATDGLWDVISNELCAQICCMANEAKRAADDLVNTALLLGSSDNITVMVIHFRQPLATSTSPRCSFFPSPQMVPSTNVQAKTEDLERGGNVKGQQDSLLRVYPGVCRVNQLSSPQYSPPGSPYLSTPQLLTPQLSTSHLSPKRDRHKSAPNSERATSPALQAGFAQMHMPHAVPFPQHSFHSTHQFSPSPQMAPSPSWSRAPTPLHFQNYPNQLNVGTLGS